MAGHYGAGIVLSLADYTAYRLRSKSEDRIAQKKRCLESIETILNAQDMKNVTEETPAIPSAPKIDRESMQYALNVAEVKRYLTMEDMIKEPSIFKRLGNYFRSVPRHELINPLRWTNTLYFAMTAELAENVVAWDYYTKTVGDSPIGGLARNVYQVPAFFVGLQTGKAIRKPIDWMVKPSDEKKADRMIKDLVLDTPIVQIVTEYEPSDNVQHQLDARGMSFNALAAPFSRGLKQLAGSVTEYGKRAEAKRKAESDARISGFDDLTKDR
jgi:hypothetical protein